MAEAKAVEAQEQFTQLMNEYNRLTGHVPGKRRRGGVPGPRKAYVISNESKIAATEKRSYTKAINAGKSEAEAKTFAAKLLGVIDKQRDMYGRPPSKPRHPDVASGAAWPAAATTLDSKRQGQVS